MLSSKTKRELKIDQRQILIDSIEIGIPSTQQILTWGERTLPNGKKVGLVKNSKTVNYKRFTPFRDGLFCERIFGPVTSFVCACGKKQPHNKVTFCEKCEVEYIDQRSRRYRLGYISLLSPVTHIWYLKGRPSYLSLFLGKRKKTIVALAYCNAYLIEHGISKRDNNLQIRDTLFSIRSRSNTKNFLQEVEKTPFNFASYSCNTFGLKGVRGSYFEKVSSSISRLNKKKGNIKNSISKNKKRSNRKFFATFLSHDIKKKEFSLSTSYGNRFYARQHTLPFLPTLMSHFYLRDVLLNFIYSSPDYNDIPLVEYCSTKRREPLQDVHKFMAHKTVEYDLSNFTQYAKKDLCKKESVFKRLRAYKIGLNTSQTGLKVSSLFSTPSFLENGSNNESYLKKQNYKLKSKSDFFRSTDLLVLKNKPSMPVVSRSKTNRVKIVNLQIYALQFFYLYAKGGGGLSTFTVPQIPLRGSLWTRSLGKKECNSKALLLRKKGTSSSLVEAELLKFSKLFASSTLSRRPLRSKALELCVAKPARAHLLTKRRFVRAKVKKKESWKLRFLKKLPSKGLQKKKRRGAIDENPILAPLCIPQKGPSGIRQGKALRGSKRKTLEASLLRKSEASGLFDAFFIKKATAKDLKRKAFATQTKFCVAKALKKPPEEQKLRFSDNVLSTTETKSCKGTSLSGLELTAIREILSYTGGGALQQLLKQFDQHDLCKFLFAEAQILRVLYETHLANFSNVLVNENQQYTYVTNKKSIIQHSLIVPAYSSFLVQIKRFATFLTPQKLTFSSKRPYGKRVPGRAYHLSRSHKSFPQFSKLFRKDFIKSFFLFGKKGARQVRGQRIVRGNFVSRSELTFIPGIQKSTLLLNSEKSKIDYVNFSQKQSFRASFPFTFARTKRRFVSRCARAGFATQNLVCVANEKRSFSEALLLREGSGTPIQNKKLRCKIKKGTSMTVDSPVTRTSLQDQILGNLVSKRSFVSQIYNKKSCKVISILPRANSLFTRGNFRCELLTPYTCFAARAVSGFSVAKNPKSFASTKEGQRPIYHWGKSARVKRNQLENNFGEKELRSKKEKKIYLTPDELQNKVNDLRKKQIIRISKRIYKIARRLKVTQLLTRNHRRPEWMILSHLPVLPPDLRPILQMSEKVIVASDLNIMYQRVIYRNNRHLRVRFIDFHLVTAIQRLVQDAVDRLIENGKGGSKPYYTQSGRPLKSLSDILKGKKGRFRLNLLGKRVDFSGRSVIVVSPSCKIHECGLPKDIALELYHYFLLRQLIVKKYCASIVTAKKMIKSKSSLMWDILRELMYHHPVLLNRAPTLHRLGIQAFQPKLVLGNAILLHPLVCSGFNADFDGDQMGVHLPLSFAARAESWDLLWSRNNLLSPATGQPMLVPSQDMVLGFYYITAPSLQNFSSNSNPNISTKDFLAPACPKPQKRVSAQQIKTKFDNKSKNLYKKNKRFLFLSTQEITTTFQKGDIKLHTPVWLHWNGKIENEDISQIPLELRVDSFGKQQFVYEKYIYSNFFTKDRNENEDRPSNVSIGFATIPKKQSFQVSFPFTEGAGFATQNLEALLLSDRRETSTFGEGERNLEAPFLRKSQEETKQLPYNQLDNSFFPTKIYQPFSFICTKPQVHYVRTTAGRILMNNLLDIKKNI